MNKLCGNSWEYKERKLWLHTEAVPDSSKEIVSPGCDGPILLGTVGRHKHRHLSGYISVGQQQNTVGKRHKIHILGLFKQLQGKISKMVWAEHEVLHSHLAIWGWMQATLGSAPQYSWVRLAVHCLSPAAWNTKLWSGSITDIWRLLEQWWRQTSASCL